MKMDWVAKALAVTWLSVLPFAHSAAVKVATPVELKYTGYTATSADGGAGKFGSGLESTFGAGYLTSIAREGNPADIFWQQGMNNEMISFMIYGIADASNISGGTQGQKLFNVGCTNAAFGCDGKIHLDFYLDKAVGGTNPGFAGTDGLKASDRTAFNRFGAMTDGVLLMSLTFDVGIVTEDDPTTAFDERTATFFQDVSNITLPATGSGRFFASCVAGILCPTFDTNGQNKGLSDFHAVNTLTAVDPNSGEGKNGWGGRNADPIASAMLLPEPGSVMLMVLGLAGAGLALRRR